MKKKSLHINTFLLVIASLIVIVKTVEFKQNVEKKDEVLKSMENKKNNLSNYVRDCERISDFSNVVPIYGSHKNKSNAKKIDRYWELKNTIDSIYYKLMVLTSHTSFVLDKFSFYKDKISNNVYLGTVDNPLIHCDGESIRINNVKMPFQGKESYKASIRDNIEIKYHRYKLNYLMEKIDTTEIIRYIEKGTLYNK